MNEETASADVRLRKIVQQRLESLQRAGVTHLMLPAGIGDGDALPATVFANPENRSPVSPTAGEERPASITESTPPPPQPGRQQPSEESLVSAQAATPTPSVDRAAALRVLQEEVARCTLCSELAETRKQTVFGVGNINPRVVFMGEAPGFDEDQQGEPFVGAAGQLLTKIIENGMGLRRQDVYILNTLKCRPPKNRTPTPDETANCRGFFEQQLDILRPEYIVCLGAVAAQNLLETKQSIARMRGRFLDYRGVKVLVTYHPAYLLRYPDEKRKTWEDIKFLMRDMGMEVK